jgi:Tfp pilus assembly protein PilF
MMLHLLTRAARWVPLTGDSRTERAPVSPAPAARALEPAAARLKVGRDLLALGDVRAALRAFDDAITLDATLAMAHFSRAVCLAQLDEEDEAFAALDFAMRLGIDGAAMSVRFARICLREGQDALAMRLLAAAFTEEPALIEKVAQEDGFRALRDHPVFLQMIGAL